MWFSNQAQRFLNLKKKNAKSESQGKTPKKPQNCTWRIEEKNFSVKTGIKSSLRKEETTNTSKYHQLIPMFCDY